MGAVRRGRSCVRGGNGEVVQAAFERIARRKGRVVAAHCIREEHTRCHTKGLVGPIRGAGLDGNVTETFATSATSAIARRTRVRAMRRRIAQCSARVIDAAAERIAGHIGIHTRGECGGRCSTARIIRILRIGGRAVGLHVGAVFLCGRHRGSTTRAASTAAGTAGAAFTRAGRRSRAGRGARFGFFTTEGQQG